MTVDPDKFDYPTTNSLAFYHSSISLLAQFKLLMEDRFTQKNLPWQYSDNEEETGVFISTEMNIPEERSNESPLIVIGKGSTVWKQVVQGDKGTGNDTQLKKGTKQYYGRLETDINIQAVSLNYGESSILGDIIQSTVATGRQPIKRYLGIQDIGPVVLQPTSDFEFDEQKWQTAIQFRITYEQTWVHVQTGPTYNGFNMTLKTNQPDGQTQKVIENIFYSNS